MSIDLFSGIFFFFFNDTATTEIYTLSLHDALPISPHRNRPRRCRRDARWTSVRGDRKSTRLNSSHTVISYAVFCLKKKNTQPEPQVTCRDQVWYPTHSSSSIQSRLPTRRNQSVGFVIEATEPSTFAASFFFHDSATTQTYTLPLRDALPI